MKIWQKVVIEYYSNKIVIIDNIIKMFANILRGNIHYCYNCHLQFYMTHLT